MRKAREPESFSHAWLREAPRHASEPPEPPQAEEAADDGEDLVRKLVAAQWQRRISRWRVVAVYHSWFIICCLVD